MITAAAALFIAAIGNAQVAKQPVKATTGKEVTAVKKHSIDHKSASTASVTPQPKAANKSAATAIKRKHHKKTKAAMKTGKK